MVTHGLKGGGNSTPSPDAAGAGGTFTVSGNSDIAGYGIPASRAAVMTTSSSTA